MTTAADIKRQWHLIDLDQQILGRVATRISQLLMGKNKVYYVPHLDCGDYIVAINAARVKLTGKKAHTKTYARHSNYPGGFRKISYQKMADDPRQAIRLAVKGMLPDNKLQADRLARLKIFADDKHPYQDKINKKPAQSGKSAQ